jgi:hypothetical protein
MLYPAAGEVASILLPYLSPSAPTFDFGASLCYNAPADAPDDCFLFQPTGNNPTWTCTTATVTSRSFILVYKLTLSLQPRPPPPAQLRCQKLGLRVAHENAPLRRLGTVSIYFLVNRGI